MSENILGSRPSPHPNGDAILIEPRGLELARPDLVGDGIENPAVLEHFVKEQLDRDIADIEQATEALRRAEPALQSWVKPATPAVAASRPLWLLIGVLWLLTALVAGGAVVAIAALTR